MYESILDRPYCAASLPAEELAAHARVRPSTRCCVGTSVHQRCGKRRCCGCWCHALRWLYPAACACVAAIIAFAYLEPTAGVWLTLSAPDGALVGLLEPGFEQRESTGEIFFWENIQDGIRDGTVFSSSMNAICTGVWPGVLVVCFFAAWFWPASKLEGWGSIGLFVAVLGQSAKWTTWFLIAALQLALAFKLALVWDWLATGANLVFINADIAADTGAFLLAGGIFSGQLLSNSMFLITRHIPGDGDEADALDERARRTSVQNFSGEFAGQQRPGEAAQRPLFVSVWRQVMRNSNQHSCLRLALAIAMQLVVWSALVGAVFAGYYALFETCFRFDFTTQLQWNIFLKPVR